MNDVDIRMTADSPARSVRGGRWGAWRHAPWLALAAVLAMTALTYRGVVHNGFVLDDFHTVANNRSLDSFARAGEWFWSGDGVSGLRENRGYRPVLMASYALDRALWGPAPTGYHVGNLLVHLVVVVLTFVSARRLWGNAWAGVGASAWVALHPLNAEAVNYVTARSSSLMTAWILAAVCCYDASITRGLAARTVVLRRAGALLLALAALGTKEAAVVLPVLVMVWDRARSDGWGWRVTVIRSLPFWGLTAMLLAVRSGMLGSTMGVEVVTGAAQDALFAGKIALVSLGHWFWPAGLAIDYAWPTTIGPGEAAAIVAGLALVAGATWAVFRYRSRVGWSLVWFGLSLGPVAILPFVTRLTLYQEHRSYLGGIALAWVVGWALVTAGGAAARYRAGPAALAVLVGGMLGWAISVDAGRTRVWVDHEHVWEDTLATYPRSALGYSARGIRLADSGRLDEARAAFERSLAIDSSISSTHNFLGGVFWELGYYDRAIEEFQLAQVIAPSNTNARMSLGKAYEWQGEPQKALMEYERLVRDYPRHGPSLTRSALLLDGAGRLSEAAERYARVLAVDPGDDAVRSALGTVLLRLQRWGDAEQAFSSLAARHPELPEVWFNLGVAREGLGLDATALEAFHRAAALEAADPDPYFRIGVIHARRGAWAEASAAYERALARDPAHRLSHMNAALAAEQQGDRGRARKHYRVLAAARGADHDDLRARARAALGRLGVRGERG